MGAARHLRQQPPVVRRTPGVFSQGGAVSLPLPLPPKECPTPGSASPSLAGTPSIVFSDGSLATEASKTLVIFLYLLIYEIFAVGKK